MVQLDGPAAPHPVHENQTQQTAFGSGSATVHRWGTGISPSEGQTSL